MSRRTRALAFAIALLLPLPAASREKPLELRGAEVVGESVVPELSEVELRDLPRSPQWQPGDPIREIPRRGAGRPGPFEPEPPTGPDALLDTQAAAPLGANLEEILNFAGQGFNGIQPPDTVGDVGPGIFIQMINCGSGSCLVAYDTADGTVVDGPVTLDTLGSGGACASGLGDPIVLYDPLADRWLLSEFASGGNHLCVYVSETSDPLGKYCRYDFATPQFPDYPKYGVWSDAFYVTTNESDRGVYAIDRENMITCGVARPFQRFLVPDLNFGFNALTPADLDGAEPPPAGAPGIIMGHRDTEAHGPAGFPDEDRLEQFTFDVDWDVPGNSTLSQQPDLVTSEFDSNLCGLVSFNCFPQPSGPTLDPLREVIMFRLAYRNFGTHETLVGNFVTDVDATDHGGKRWFELRRADPAVEGSAWTLFQEGTYAPDVHHRWMGAVSMDGDGNLALAYNTVSTTLHSGLRYTGRLASDPPGTMTATETVLAAGAGSNSSNRYGDYAAMSVDPEDDCTFWFTGEYNPAAQWATRIGALRFSSCTGGAIFQDGFETGDTSRWDSVASEIEP